MIFAQINGIWSLFTMFLLYLSCVRLTFNVVNQKAEELIKISSYKSHRFLEFNFTDFKPQINKLIISIVDAADISKLKDHFQRSETYSYEELEKYAVEELDAQNYTQKNGLVTANFTITKEKDVYLMILPPIYSASYAVVYDDGIPPIEETEKKVESNKSLLLLYLLIPVGVVIVGILILKKKGICCGGHYNHFSDPETDSSDIRNDDDSIINTTHAKGPPISEL